MHLGVSAVTVIPISSATFGVGERPPAVQIAQEGPPVLGLHSTTVPAVGVRRQSACFFYY